MGPVGPSSCWTFGDTLQQFQQSPGSTGWTSTVEEWHAATWVAKPQTPWCKEGASGKHPHEIFSTPDDSCLRAQPAIHVRESSTFPVVDLPTYDCFPSKKKCPGWFGRLLHVWDAVEKSNTIGWSARMFWAVFILQMHWKQARLLSSHRKGSPSLSWTNVIRRLAYEASRTISIQVLSTPGKNFLQCRSCFDCSQLQPSLGDTIVTAIPMGKQFWAVLAMLGCGYSCMEWRHFIDRAKSFVVVSAPWMNLALEKAERFHGLCSHSNWWSED